MNRRQFVTASLLSITGSPTPGQVTHAHLKYGATEALPSQGSLPDLGGASHWLNTEPLSKRSLRGRVVLINFWTYSCINSLRPLPYLKDWATKYERDELVVLGIHTPEFTFEKERKSVEWALREFKIAFPVAMDNDYRIWHAFQNAYWPAFYLVDHKGTIRYRRFGEGQYDQTERVIRVLLEKNGAADASGNVEATGIEAPPGADVRTPETYVGYRRAGRFRSPERVARDARKTYTVPAALPLHQWGLDGAWEVGDESGLLREAHGKIVLRFHSRDLHLVLSPTGAGKPVPFRVLLEGTSPGEDAGIDVDSNGIGEIREPRLYQLIRQKGRIRERLFAIEFLQPGVRAFSFTFG